ncbi:MAG TPA: hypothetical protein ENI42_02850 [Thermoplasmatales archaeon]|nr:hypothetical protein [Thermoplasmatales archaeon]
MYLQAWVTAYFIAAIFCILTARLFIKSKNTSRLLLGYLVIASGCWALLDGLTQILNPEISLVIQNGALFVSAFVAFLFFFLSYSFIKHIERKTLYLLVLIPLFVGLLFSLFGDIYYSAERVYMNGFSYVHMIYNDVNYTLTVSILFILILAGFILIGIAVKTTRDETLRKNIKFFTAGTLTAVASTYILGSGEVLYHLPPLSSIAISIGIAISSLSFKTKRHGEPTRPI